MNNLGDWIQIAEAAMKFSMMVMLGLYFTFSNTIMKSLKNLDNGADVMVEINRVILNPVFMGCFILSGVSSAYFAVATEAVMATSGAVFFIGTTLVTVIKNVPLNNKLRDAADHNSRQQVWAEYLDKWVFWNHVRTASAIASGFLLVL